MQSAVEIFQPQKKKKTGRLVKLDMGQETTVAPSETNRNHQARSFHN